MNGLLDFLQGASNAAASNVSGPVDLIGMGLRKLGVPVPQNALLSSQWMEERGLTRKPKNALAAMAGETVGLLSPVVAAAKAPQIARGLLQVGENAAAPNVVNRGAAKGQRGVFMGDLSKTWNKEAAAKAEEMEQAGADARAIWQETGTFRGADGKWRQEIDDSASKYIENKAASEFMAGPGPAEYPVGPISNILQHKGIEAAYPDAMAIRARLQKGESGAYIPNTGFGEGFNVPSSGAHSTLLHELQHAIQQRQGFAQGGSVGEFASGPMFDKKARDLAGDFSKHLTGGISAKPEEIISSLKYGDPTELQQIASRYGFQSLDDAVSFLQKQDWKRTPFGQYQRLAGEAEARAVQSRMNLTPQQRRALFPFDSYDVPVDSLIVR